MLDYLVEFAVPAFLTIVMGWMTFELIGANADAQRWNNLDE